jgi:uncharacterized protein YfaS (alpha-2-macroglobulin family)
MTFFPRHFLQTALRTLFGSFQWSPPGWLAAARPSRCSPAACRTLSVLAALLLGGTALCWWITTRPQPETTALRIEIPQPMGLEPNALPRPLRILFARSAAPAGQAGRPLGRGVTLEPYREGTWAWVDDRELQFIPKAEWPADTAFTVRMEKSLVAPGLLLASYAPSFQTPRLTCGIDALKLYVNPMEPSIKEITATLRFNYAIDPSSLEKAASLSGKDLSALLRRDTPGAPDLKFTYDARNRLAYLRSAPVRLPDEDHFINLNISDSVRAAEGRARLASSATGEIRIPNLYSFLRVESAQCQVTRTPEGKAEHLLVIATSSGIATADLARHLKIYQLPRCKPGSDDPYSWDHVAEVDDTLLALSKPVPAAIVPPENENTHPTLHLFRIQPEEESWIFVRIDRGMEGLGGFIMRNPYTCTAQALRFPREVRFVHEGALLALSGERRISVSSRSVDAIQIEAARVRPEQINHLVTQTSGDFQNPVFQNYRFSENDLCDILTRVEKVGTAHDGSLSYSGFDLGRFLGRENGEGPRGLFLIRATAWDTDEDQPLAPDSQDGIDYDRNGDRAITDRRLVLVTDLGFLVKDNADGTRDVFVQNIHTGAPVAGAQILVLARNGSTLQERATGEDGRASLPALLDAVREKQPVAFVVRDGDDTAFMPFARSDRRLNTSRFDVGGIVPESASELAAFLFSDRGLYRPGDTIHFGVAVKQRDWLGALKDVPVYWSLANSRGQEVACKAMQLPAGGFFEVTYATRESDPSGPYTLSLRTNLESEDEEDRNLGSCTVTVREFEPDRMRIKVTELPDQPGWSGPEQALLQVDLQTLLGTPAAGRRVTTELQLLPAEESFPAFPGYTFHTAHDTNTLANTLANGMRMLPDAQTDAAGRTSLPLGLSDTGNGLYRVNYVVRGFEPDSGRSISTGGFLLVSRAPFLIGTKPDGDFSFIRKDSVHTLNLLAVDPSLVPCAVPGLTLELVENSYVSVLTRKPNGNFEYESVRREKPVHAAPFDLAAAKTPVPLDTSRPGSYLLRVRDGAKKILAETNYMVAGEGEMTRSLEKDAELILRLDKETYEPGDEAELQITAPYAGAGLITIERDKVYNHVWFRSAHAGTVQKIRIPDTMEGNGYVHVSFLRSAGSEEIYSSPLCSAVAPFRIAPGDRALKLTLQTAAEVKPGTPLVIHHAASRSTDLVVYAVDEGILQAARYALPQPLDTFLARQALQVESYQILDLVLPEFSVAKKVSAWGGDGGEDMLAANLNPFKRKVRAPAVFWSGIVHSDPKGGDVTFNVPDSFNGTLRIMAVAVRDDAAGSAEITTLVQAPFVIQPNHPWFAAPGDVFDVTATVTNTLKGSGDSTPVIVNLSPSQNLALTDAAPREAAIGEGKDATLHWNVRALDIPGNAELAFVADGAGQSSLLTGTLSVRPATARRIEILSGRETRGTFDIPLTRPLYPRHAETMVVVSSLPLAFIHGLNAYLQDYPHLCTEQLTSRALATLALAKLPGFGLSREEAGPYMERILQGLRVRQNPDGAFGLWSAQNDLQFDFPSVYLMHFLTEAKEDGYPVDSAMFERGMDHLEKIAADSPQNLGQTRIQAYAIYLLTRNGKVTSNYLERLVNHLQEDHPDTWRNDLAASYAAATWSLLKNQKEALRLLPDFRAMRKAEAVDTGFYSGLSRDAQHLYLLSRHFPDKAAAMTETDLDSVVTPVAENLYSTYSAAYAILALQAYAEKTSTPGGNALTIDESVEPGVFRRLGTPAAAIVKIPFSPEAKSLRIKAEKLPAGRSLYWQVITTGFDRTVPSTPEISGLEVQRAFYDSRNQPLRTMAVGNLVNVEIQIRTVRLGEVDNIAVLDLLPAGLELVPDSFENNSSRSGSIDHVEPREDRILFYGSFDGSISTLRYQARATAAGTFAVPAVQAESMYNRSIHGRSAPARITITPAS